ncbi:sensor histidine kinase [Cohnella yongneupensis]|uniref:Histidine kinase n=1 Tax=Cohnella yongneupensis TaxID=425006 RepID=A0ABW0R0H8_9BACL
MKLRHSLSFKFFIGICLMCIPLIAFLFYNNIYSMNVVRNKVASTNNALLTPYVDQIDSALQETSKYLSTKAFSDFDINTLNYYPVGTTDYVLTRIAIVNKFSTDIYLNSSLDALFMYKRDVDDLAVATQTDYYAKEAMIKSNIAKVIRDYEEKGVQNWEIVSAGGRYFLVQVVKANKEVYVGSWIDLAKFAAPLNPDNAEDTGQALLLTAQGKPLTEATLSEETLQAVQSKMAGLADGYQTVIDGKQKYLMLGQKSKIADVYFAKLIPEQQMLKELFYFQRAIYFLPLGAVVIMLLFLLFMKRLFMNPVAGLIGGMRKIGQGKLDVRLMPDKTNEFAYLAQSFNKMAQEMQDLTIHVYEEKLRVQQAEFKHLQVQINPHFYMNSLNLVYNMAVLEDFSSVKKLSVHLAEYFRFIIKTNGKNITLQEEIQHIRNYLEIQQLRFEDRLRYEIELPEEWEPFVIPPLVVQPFVENAIIHGFKKMKKPFEVNIRVSRDPESQDRLLAVISDNGVGFPPDMLAQLQTGSYYDRTDNDHIGIWNVMHRLNIQYGNQARVEFRNGEDGGAEARIYLPRESA